MYATDRIGGTSRQAETCILCGGGWPQLECIRVEEPGSTWDLWICPRCWAGIRPAMKTMRAEERGRCLISGALWQTETCTGGIQLECTRVIEPGSTHDLWICPNCWAGIMLNMELSDIGNQWRFLTRKI